MHKSHRRAESLTDDLYKLTKNSRKQDFHVSAKNRILSHHKSQSPINSSKSKIPFLHNLEREKEEMKERHKKVQNQILKEMSKLQTIDKDLLSNRYIHLSNNSVPSNSVLKPSLTLSPLKYHNTEQKLGQSPLKKDSNQLKTAKSLSLYFIPKMHVSEVSSHDSNALTAYNKLDKIIGDYSHKITQISRALGDINERKSHKQSSKFAYSNSTKKYRKEIEKGLEEDFVKLLNEKKDANYSAIMMKKSI